MLFHLGALWRLNEMGLLGKLDRVSSVSGGSIAAAVVGLHWSSLAFGNDGVGRDFRSVVVAPVRHLADRTIDAGAILGGNFASRLDLRQGRRCVPQASVWRYHPPELPRPAAVRHRCDECPDRSPLPLQQAVRRRLPCGRREDPAGRARDRRGRLLGLSSGPLAARARVRAGRDEPPRWRRSARRAPTRPKSSSPS